MNLSYKQKFISLAIIYGLVLVFITAISNYFIGEKSLSNMSKEFMQNKILEKRDYFKNFIFNSKDILVSILENKNFIEFISNGKNIENIQELFISIAKVNRDIMQLRYIDINGNEIIRVDQKNRKLFLIEKDKLQNKAHRDYFVNSLNLPEDKFYISKMDLNIEKGEIEYPIKPTIRFARVVFNKSGIKKGIVIVNFSLREVIKKLKDLIVYDFFMVDGNGNFLIHPREDKSWTKELNRNYTLKDEFKENANQILKNNFFVNSHLVSKKLEFLHDRDIRIILDMKFEEIEKNRKEKEFYTIVIMLFTILLSLPFAYFLSLVPEKLMKQLKNNLNFQEELFKTIPIPIFFKDTKGSFINCNEAFCEFLGTSKDNIIGKGTLDFATIEYAKYQSSVEKKLISQNGFIANEEDFIYKDGLKKTIILHKTALVQNFLVTGIIGSIVDITDRKRFEEELKDTQKKITDSIKFSALIQSSILPFKESFKEYLDDFFIIWKPKDIVGGDIYLFEKFENGCLIFVVDCTGHGVPGAFMTMITKTALNSIVDKTNCFNPATILKELNISIKNILKQEQNSNLSGDVGLDMGVAFYEKKESKVTFAGAKIALFYIENEELKVIKGDRESIGYRKSNSNFEFSNTTIEIKDDSYFYITTDGLIDQNGGSKDLPFGKSKLKELLIENHKFSFEKQKELICKKLTEYQGNSERNDDVTMIGFKIKGGSA